MFGAGIRLFLTFCCLLSTIDAKVAASVDEVQGDEEYFDLADSPDTQNHNYNVSTLELYARESFAGGSDNEAQAYCDSSDHVSFLYDDHHGILLANYLKSNTGETYSVKCRTEDCVIQKTDIHGQKKVSLMSKKLFLNHGPTGKHKNFPPMRAKDQVWDRIDFTNSRGQKMANTRFCSLIDLWTALDTKAAVGKIWQSDPVYTRTAYKQGKENYDDNCLCPMNLGTAKKKTQPIKNQKIVHAVPCKEKKQGSCKCEPCL